MPSVTRRAPRCKASGRDDTVMTPRASGHLLFPVRYPEQPFGVVLDPGMGRVGQPGRADRHSARGPVWRSRIVGSGEEAPDQLLANPANWRVHPEAQQDALAGLLGQVGWVQQILVNRRTGHVVDGHLRVALARSGRTRRSCRSCTSICRTRGGGARPRLARPVRGHGRHRRRAAAGAARRRERRLRRLAAMLVIADELAQLGEVRQSERRGGGRHRRVA